ncbi:MAG: hypothetical protein HY547_08700 [Elusimicrobia bacterium]|nr:hypothetical protein [Elusimicrobiota bacterium]
MRDKIELLVEETGATSQEAELAFGLAHSDVEGALKILHSRMKDAFVIKAKIMSHYPPLYGRMLFIAHVPGASSQTSFRLRFVFSENPHLYETTLDLPWHEFEKEIYRARLSEWCQVAVSQSLEKEWEVKIVSQMNRLVGIKEALLAGREDAVQLWLEDMVASSRCWRVPPKFCSAAEVLTMSEYRREPADANNSGFGKQIFYKNSQVPGGGIFLNLRIALQQADHLPPQNAGPRHAPLRAADLQAGDWVQAYILETEDTRLYMAEVLGGCSNAGLHAVEAPIESVWEEGPLTGVRVRFGHSVVGEGTFPPDLRVQVLRKKQSKSTLFQRILSW